MEKIKQKIRLFVSYYKLLPKQKKLIIAILIVSFCVFAFGSVYIIANSVFNVEEKIEKSRYKEISEELDSTQKDITMMVGEYSIESYKEIENNIDANFDNYDTQLKLIDAVLNDFQEPISAPID